MPMSTTVWPHAGVRKHVAQLSARGERGEPLRVLPRLVCTVRLVSSHLESPAARHSVRELGRHTAGETPTGVFGDLCVKRSRAPEHMCERPPQWESALAGDAGTLRLAGRLCTVWFRTLWD